MKKSILLFCVLISYNLYSQKIGEMYLPKQNQDTPEWFTFFYRKDFVENINIFKLDMEAKEYEESFEKENEEKDVEKEILTGEENENIYLLYYKRWRKSVCQYIQDDGTLKNNDNPNFRKHLTNTELKSRAPGSSWSLLGPVSTWWKYSDNPAQPQAPWQANIYSCAMANTNHNILFAAPETGGIFKTSDGGANWSLILDQINVGNSNIATYSGDAFYSLAIDPSNSDVVYAGRNNLIKKSTDGGSNWIDITISGCGDVNEIAIDPSNTAILYAACGNGLYKSTNYGANWTLKLSNTMYDVALKPGSPSTVYVLREISNTITKFHYSLDGGDNWTESFWSGNGIVSDDAARMSVTVANPEVIYAVILVRNPEDKPYMFRSTNSGVSWTLLCTGQTGTLTGNSTLPLGMSNGQGYFDLDILANPNNAAEVIVATTSAYKSTNAMDASNVSFSPLGGYNGSFSIHPDIQWMVAHGNDTWIATDGGMNYSSDFFTNTSNFSCKSTGIYGTDFWGFTQGWNEDIIAGGKYHNGNTVMNEIYPTGQSLRLGGGEAPTGYYMVGRPRYIVFSDLSGNGVVTPSTFNGNTSSFSFTKIPNESNYGFNTSEVEFLPYCYGHVFLGNANILYKSVDGGISWQSLYDFSSPVRQIEISRSNPDVMYVCTDNNLWKTTNAGLTWTVITLPSGQNQSEKSISLSYTDENTLWICAKNNTSNNRIFKTINGGSTWINLTTSTINSGGYWNVVQQAGTDGGVYILRKGGEVYYRDNNMSDWVTFSAGLPDGYYPLRTIPFYRDGKLRTAGNRGIWQIEFYNNQPQPVAQPTVDKLTTTCVRDTFYFDDYSALYQSGATWNWTFSGTSNPVFVSSTTVRNPKVVFGNLGTYDFSLTVTNAFGTSSKTISGKIQITENQCGIDTIQGKMLTLINSGDYAQQSKGLNISTNNITLSAWIKPNGTQVSTAGIIFSASGTATGFNFRTNNQLGYHWNNSGGSYNWSGGPTVTSDEWSHVALVITPNSATIYLNGIPYTRTGTNIHSEVNFDKIFQFGIDRSNTSRNYKGEIDEICIYKRALSSSEIRELMYLTKNNPSSGCLPVADPTLIAYYQINEGAGKPIYDKIGTNHGSLLGATSSKSGNSTMPAGGGTVQTITVNNGGLKEFNLPGVKMTFPTSGTYPNGDVSVVRINSIPSGMIPNTSILDDKYWIVRNYGTNSTFTSLSSITFFNVNINNSNPSDFKLYKRVSNGYLSGQWVFIDDADQVVTGNNGSVTFDTGLNITDFSQFIITRPDCPDIVSSSANDGTYTLRNIISCIANGKTITFQNGINTTLTDYLTFGKSITIAGNGNTAINMNYNNGKGLIIPVGNNVTLKDIKLNMTLSSGPVIENSGNLTLDNTEINGNTNTTKEISNLENGNINLLNNNIIKKQ